MKTAATAVLIALTTLAATTAIARDNVSNQKQAELGAHFDATPETPAPQTSVSAEGNTDVYVDPNARVRDVSPELNEWLTRNHARPAGR